MAFVLFGVYSILLQIFMEILGMRRISKFIVYMVHSIQYILYTFRFNQMTGCSYPSITLSSCLFVSFTHTKHAWVGTFCTIIGDGGRSKGEGGLILSLPSAGIRHVSAPPFHLPLRKYIYFNLQLIFHSQKRVKSKKICHPHHYISL